MQTLSIDKLSLLEGRSPSFISRDHTYPRRHPPSSRVCRPPSSVGGKIGRVSPAHRIICLHPRLQLQLPSWVDDTVGRSSYCRYSGVQHGPSPIVTRGLPRKKNWFKTYDKYSPLNRSCRMQPSVTSRKANHK